MAIGFGHLIKRNILIETMEVSLPTTLTGPPDALLLEKEKKDENGKCQPCPPCGRCPEPAFECKKVPTYSNVDHMKNVPMVPEPIQPDYTTYGM